eukprot:TRINITY_DN6496_c0_g1_i2.p1 TRINITY_DN6496_c0_g1~~TRINITY_DN6496_c0_g1_i2.p1  ORF type:complete len:691 (+),score=129.51 TRINITY_DN6496_c0_g1_i2:227-2299(+)
MENDPQVQRTAQLANILNLLNTVNPADSRYLLTLLEARAEFTAASLVEASSKANSPDYIRSLSKDYSPIDACHALFDLVPLLHRSSFQACQEMAKIMRSITWHPHPGQTKVFCQHCIHTLTLLINHPALPPLQREELTGTMFKLINATPETIAAALEQIEAQQKQISQQPSSPQGPPVSAEVVGIEKDRHNGRDYAFVMQVKYVNGFVHECHRTHDQFFDFQCKMLDTYPEAAKKDPQTDERVLPKLIGRKLISTKSKQDLAMQRKESIAAYVKGLFKMPPGLRQCQELRAFFAADERARSNSKSMVNVQAPYPSIPTTGSPSPVPTIAAAAPTHPSSQSPISSPARQPSSSPLRPMAMSAGPGQIRSVNGSPLPAGYGPPSPYHSQTAMPYVYPNLTLHPQAQPYAIQHVPGMMQSLPLTHPNGQGPPQQRIQPLPRHQLAHSQSRDQRSASPSPAETQREPTPTQPLASASASQAARQSTNSNSSSDTGVSGMGPPPPPAKSHSAAKNQDVPGVKELKSVQRRAVAEEGRGRSRKASSSHKRTGSVDSTFSMESVTSISSGHLNKCFFCGQTDHDSFSCQVVLEQDQLRAILKDVNCQPDALATMTVDRLRLCVMQYVWLKQMRLHKYASLLAGRDSDELLAMTDTDLRELGMTSGAAKKLRNHLGQGLPFAKMIRADSVTPSMTSDV